MLARPRNLALTAFPHVTHGALCTTVYQRSLGTLSSVAKTAAQPPLGWERTQPFELPPWLQPRKTTGTVRFLGQTLDGLPAFLNFKKGLEHLTNIGASVKKKVDVTDLRYYEPPTTLAVEGVQWLRAPTCLSEDRLVKDDSKLVDDFVRGPYFRECASIVQSQTGAAKVVPYNYRHRRIEEKTDLHGPYKFSAKPLPNLHMDNDAATAEVNLRRELGEEDASHWLTKRWAIVNLWRPVGDVVRQWPLAVVDARTVAPDRDTTPIYTLSNYKTHFSALKPHHHFKFYYVSDLAPDEALLFVDYDSKKGQGIAHGAFEDHSAPERYPRRRSIEVRSLVLYDS
ncbi:hypothetical protein F5Y12DRAFT_709538 [Xylaria sp. FL1777]|nr:hypothetical protein F5Y12DRAFT_709538 [Xylaria sp. FL1777]